MHIHIKPAKPSGLHQVQLTINGFYYHLQATASTVADMVNNGLVAPVQHMQHDENDILKPSGAPPMGIDGAGFALSGLVITADGN